jgi:nitrogen fixation NifU-like protein
MSDQKDLGFVYKKEILNRSANPGFSEPISNPDKIIKGLNPFCGDEVIFNMNIHKNKISSIYLEVEGCAVHKSSSSILSEIILDEQINEIEALCNEFISYFKNDSNNSINPKLLLANPLFDIKNNQIRIKCALLSWNTIYNNLFKT